MRVDRSLAIRLSEELYTRLSRAAAAEDRSTSHLARMLLERGLEEWEKEGRLGATPTDESLTERVVLRVLRQYQLIPPALPVPRPSKKAAAPPIMPDRKKARG